LGIGDDVSKLGIGLSGTIYALGNGCVPINTGGKFYDWIQIAPPGWVPSPNDIPTNFAIVATDGSTWTTVSTFELSATRYSPLAFSTITSDPDNLWLFWVGSSSQDLNLGLVPLPTGQPKIFASESWYGYSVGSRDNDNIEASAQGAVTLAQDANNNQVLLAFSSAGAASLVPMPAGTTLIQATNIDMNTKGDFVFLLGTQTQPENSMAIGIGHLTNGIATTSEVVGSTQDPFNPGDGTTVSGRSGAVIDQSGNVCWAEGRGSSSPPQGGIITGVFENSLGCAFPTSVSINRVLNAASFDGRFAPGSIGAIFGSILAKQTETESPANGSFPTEDSAQSTDVTVNGVAAPLMYVSDSQINFQFPCGTPVGQPVTLQVCRTDFDTCASSLVTLSDFAPAFFTNFATGLPWVTDATGQPTALAPGSSGSYTLLGQGLGPPLSGTGTTYQGTAQAASPVTLTVGGINAPVVYARAVPAELIQQVTFQTPAFSVPKGATTVDCVLTVGGAQFVFQLPVAQ
jgi:uncharacterized protein (TIGR03437 family)